MRVARTIAEARAFRAAAEGTVGLVPTMGGFHAGHAALFAAARAECDAVVVSLFVNPAQFAEEADLLAYPRDEEHDLAVAAEAGVDIVFCPAASEIYPAGFQTWVDVTELGSMLEGVHRPGHFRGVATICLKLFNIVEPDVVYFGQKDAQQVEVIRRLLIDLDLEIDLHVLPTVRDADGLALSSRNALLTPEERRRALSLPRALATKDPQRARTELDGVEVDYVEVAPFDPPVIAAAVRVGPVRLIDNVVLDEEEAHEHQAA
jgi:pantoate--beta-alanine ligase